MKSPVPGEQIRALRSGEEDEFLDVLCAAFGLDSAAARPLFRADPFFDLSHKRVVWTPDEGIVSVLTIIPCPMFLGKSVVPVAGVAGVATRPDCRGRGMATRNLTAALAALGTELPYPAAALMTADPHFYRRLGWEEAFVLSAWNGAPEENPSSMNPSSLLRGVSPEGERRSVKEAWLSSDTPLQGGRGVLHSVPPENRAPLHALHERLSRNRPGACLRDSRRWHIIDRLAPARQAWAVDDANNEPAGYILLDRVDEAAPAYRIVELLAETDAARAALRAFLNRPPFPCERWEWPAAPSDFAAMELNNAQVTAMPGAMLRVCHVPHALAARHAADFAPHLRGGHSLTLRVTDEANPENAAPVLLNEHGVHVGAHGETTHEITSDIRTLAQMYTGFCSARQAADAGLLSASSEAALELATRLFPAAEPCLCPADQF